MKKKKLQKKLNKFYKLAKQIQREAVKRIDKDLSKQAELE